MTHRIPVSRHRLNDRVRTVDNPELAGTITELLPDRQILVRWDDDTESVPLLLRVVNDRWAEKRR